MEWWSKATNQFLGFVKRRYLGLGRRRRGNEMKSGTSSQSLVSEDD